MNRKMACVELVGGPTANWVYEQALDLAGAQNQVENIKILGEKLGLPRPEAQTFDVLWKSCLGNALASN